MTKQGWRDEGGESESCWREEDGRGGGQGSGDGDGGVYCDDEGEGGVVVDDFGGSMTSVTEMSLAPMESVRATTAEK